ncbi:MAG: hypothetical protein JO089_08090 [Alphaproteobacteria bacterium]|nr:hypothetical protein [Alphaproteobacteria bacterium]
MAAADAAVDAELGKAPSEADRLSASMVKAFLRLPFEEGPLTEVLSRFVEAKYEVSNEKTAQNGRWATADSEIRAGGLPSDIWSVSRAITDALSAEASPYKNIAEPVGKQMAMLIFACEKVTCDQARPFDVLESEFKKHDIAPFQNIHLFEFAGNGRSIVANRKRGVAKLLGDYQLHPGAGEGRARKIFDRFVSDARAPGIPARESGINYIIARNVFNRGAVEKEIDPDENVHNLLRAFSRALPEGGKLYISTSINDPIVIRDLPELLDSTGFSAVGDVSYCNNGKAPSYALKRDFKIKGAEPITPGASEIPSTAVETERKSGAAAITPPGGNNIFR